MRPVLIFDLDGTLVDSKKDLTVSVNYIRNRFDLPVLTEEEIARFIGNGALMLIRRALGPVATDATVQSGLQMFLSYYRAHMLDNTVLYPGVRETLERLSDCKLAVLTFTGTSLLSTAVIASITRSLTLWGSTRFCRTRTAIAIRRG